MRWHDWLILVCSAALVLLGPAFSLLELSKAQEQKASFEITGVLPPVDGSVRDAWRLPVTILVIATGLLGTLVLVRTLLDAGVRALVKRLLALLMLGLVTLYVTYWADGAFFATAPYGLRATTIVWLYPLAGVLIAGSAHRIAEISEHFGRAARTAAGEVVI